MLFVSKSWRKNSTATLAGRANEHQMKSRNGSDDRSDVASNPLGAGWFSWCLGVLLCAGLLIRFVLQRALLLISRRVRPSDVNS
jgi:hypothetical protein